MTEKQENFDGESFAVKDFIEKVKGKIPFIKKDDLQKEKSGKVDVPTNPVNKEQVGAKLKEFKLTPQSGEDLSRGFSEYMQKEGLEKIRAEDRQRLADAETELAEFERKYSEKHGQSQNLAERNGYKLKHAFLEEEVRYLRGITPRLDK